MEKDKKSPELGFGSSKKDDEEKDFLGGTKKSNSSKKRASANNKIKHSEHPSSNEEDDRSKHGFLSIRNPKKDSDAKEQGKEYDSTPDVDKTSNEEVADQDVYEATVALIDYRGEAVLGELNQIQNDNEQEFEVLADAAFLESLREKVIEEESITEDIVDKAFHEAATDLSLEDEKSIDNSEDNSSQTVEEQVLIERDQAADSEVEPDLESAETKSDDGINNSQNQSSSSLTNQTPPTAQATSTNSPPVVPPVGPPRGPNNSPPPFANGGVQPPIGPNFNTPQNVLIPPPVSRVEYVGRGRFSRGFIVGGILGYIVGRRGGRKHAEKHLKPEIKNLESKIESLHDTITRKEVQIRNIAKESIKKHTVDADKIVKIFETRQKNIEAKEVSKRRKVLEENSEKAEKIGKFSLPALEVFRERRLIPEVETSEKRKSVEQMTVYELLQFADKIIIGGTSVKKFFESKSLSEESLREIVKNYLRKGPYEKVFWQELSPDKLGILDNHQKINQSYEIESNKLDRGNRYIIDNLTRSSASTKNIDTNKDVQSDSLKSGIHDYASLESKPPYPVKTNNKLPQVIAVVVVFAVLLILLVLLSKN